MAEQMPPQGADQQGQGGGMAEGLSQLKSSLEGLLQAVTQAKAPAEVLDPLKESVQYFNEFYGLMTGGGAPAEAPQGTQDQAAGGNPNAVPA